MNKKKLHKMNQKLADLKGFLSEARKTDKRQKASNDRKLVVMVNELFDSIKHVEKNHQSI